MDGDWAKELESMLAGGAPPGGGSGGGDDDDYEAYLNSQLGESEGAEDARAAEPEGAETDHRGVTEELAELQAMLMRMPSAHSAQGKWASGQSPAWAIIAVEL